MGRTEAQGRPWGSTAAAEAKPSPHICGLHFSSQAMQEEEELNPEVPCNVDVVAL